VVCLASARNQTPSLYYITHDLATKPTKLIQDHGLRDKIHKIFLSNFVGSHSEGRIKINKLRWAGHVIRRGNEEIMKRIILVKPERKRKKCRPRMRWMDGVEKDLRTWVWLTGKQRRESGTAGQDTQWVAMPKKKNNNNSILYYLCAESTALRPITDTAQCTLSNYIVEQYNIDSKVNYRQALEKIHINTET
jgi:hypothetical protein